ncbi:MAG: peptide chain release factor N(5)-glutamine methyltransferase [Flavobacteriaceae bacterium]
MTLLDFKLKMISELSSIYEMDELNSIFNLLSENYLKIPRSKILLAKEIDLNESDQILFLSGLERLKTHEPIQYVLGKTSFMDLEFKVNSSVLIPRPETEELVRVMLKEDLDGKEILDIGTGSGCIAISLAKNLPNAKVTALDISIDALDVAKENARLNNVDIEFIKADIFEYQSNKKYDVIVSNPPYVTESEKSLMKKNVLDFEPELALFVEDNNALKYYDSILKFGMRSMKKMGYLFFEINANLYSELQNICLINNYINLNSFIDSSSKTRFLLIKK